MYEAHSRSGYDNRNVTIGVLPDDSVPADPLDVDVDCWVPLDDPTSFLLELPSSL